MTVVNKASVPAPTPPMETVEADGIGEVIVRGLMLRDRLALMSDDGPVFDKVSAILAACVVDSDKRPLWTVEAWEAYGAQRFDAALKLFNVAQRLSGLTPGDAEKK